MTLWDEGNETPETEESDETELPLDGDDEVDYNDGEEIGQYLEDACWN